MTPQKLWWVRRRKESRRPRETVEGPFKGWEKMNEDENRMSASGPDEKFAMLGRVCGPQFRK